MTDQYKPLRVISDVPRSSLLHPDFAYISAARTNIAATFERVRRERENGAEHIERREA